LFEEPTRKPIPIKVKRQVYNRAKGRCEKCGIHLKINEGDFHHIRDATVTPRATSIRFLCPLCHRKYGHKRITRYDDWTGTEIKTIPRVVVKLRKKKPKTKRVAIRNILGDIISYRTVKIRKRRKGKKKINHAKKNIQKKRSKRERKKKGR
jgi:hypothetical protein